MVVNQDGDVCRSVRSEIFVMLFDSRNFVREVVGSCTAVSGLSCDNGSGSVLNSLVFAGCHSYKRIESPHVMNASGR